MTSMETSTPVVVGIISVFRAPEDLGSRIATLLTQLDRVVVVDDGSHTAGPLRNVDDLIHVVELDENKGIAFALNAGIDQARELGATHLVTLDQDSELPPGYVGDAMHLLDRLDDRGMRVAAIVPERFGSTRVVTSQEGVPLDPIQSGQLIPLRLFDEIGGFAEELFIDSVDTEFTLRARAAGYEFHILNGSTLDHALGDQTPIRVFGKHLVLFGRPRHLHYHRPFRTYYIVRNGLTLWRMHRPGNVAWLTRRTAAMVWAVLLSSALSPDRGAQFEAARLGLRDARRRRLGKIPQDVLARLTSRPRVQTRASV
jgi:rhamnosyltransferase